MATQGRIVVFEGIDRSGKSSLARAIVARHSGVCEYMSFPDRSTTLGAYIDSMLRGRARLSDAHSMHLLFSANRYDAIAEMQRKLDAGITLVVDRYVPSGAAYSAARGLNIDWCLGADAEMPAPDLVIFLDADPETAAARAGFGEELFEKLDFQKRVASAYERVRAAYYPERWAVVVSGDLHEAEEQADRLIFG